MPIKILAPDVAAKIAAGEVVERPANVAKELIENSLDAGATEIRVDLREGGQRLLRVTDNGGGVPPDEIPLAFERHATSKVTAADDLDHIATLGFRGEALYSIAAVSHVTFTSRHAEQESAVQLRVEGGQVVHQSRAGAPVGTSVTVERLFHNVPARRKFLRKPVTEAGRISAIVQRYALAYPECRFILVNEGRETFRSTGSGDPFDVLVQVRGLEQARQMVRLGNAVGGETAVMGGPGLEDEVSFMHADGLPARDTFQRPLRVHGFTSLPSLTRANRGGIELFVNRRYVEDRSLTHAVVQAYHTLLPVGRFPLTVLTVELDPSEVDVNVHPQKTEIRFVDERAVFRAVQLAVRQAIVQYAPVPDMAVEPDEGIDAWRDRRDQLLRAGSQTQFAFQQRAPEQPAHLHAEPNLDGDAGWSSLPGEAQPAVDAQSAPTSREQATTRGGTQSTLSAPGKLPPLRVVGQVGALDIIAEGPQGVYLIDQHAAHERILYEQFNVKP